VLSAFPQAWRWKPLRFNELILAFDRPVSHAELLERVGRISPPAGALVPLFRGEVKAVRAQGDVLTDDRAPVEWLTDRMIFEQIARGEGLDEERLPTEP
jgi:hypothetical protein